MMPRFLAWEIRSMALPFTELEKTEGEASLGGKTKNIGLDILIWAFIRFLGVKQAVVWDHREWEYIRKKTGTKQLLPLENMGAKLKS